MKKLSKLRLKEFHEMSDLEMQKVVGGYGNTDSDTSYVESCKGTYSQCSGSCTKDGKAGKCKVKQAETMCKCQV